MFFFKFLSRWKTCLSVCATLEAEHLSTTTRQAKSKALEAISITNNKRRIETDSDINEDQEDSKKRSSSSRRSTVHASNPLRHHKQSEKLARIKTYKRQRQSSSEEEEEERIQQSKSKRNSVGTISHQNQRKQSENTDTGNLCVRRRTGKIKSIYFYFYLLYSCMGNRRARIEYSCKWSFN